MPDNCAEGVKDWGTSWFPPENKVIVEVEFETKELAVAFADEMGDRFRGDGR